MGDIVLIPKNFEIREHRGMWAKVIEIHGDLLRLQTILYTFDATTEDISARRALGVIPRWEILDRDRFCCRICGRRARPGLELHVDHAKSFHDGGKTEDLDNLWTLCSDCNFGKGTLSMEKVSSAPLISTTELNHTRELLEKMVEQMVISGDVESKDLAQLLSSAYKMLEEISRIESPNLPTM